MKVLRLAGRVTLLAVALAVLGVVGVQYESIVARNVAVAHELDAARRDVAALESERARDLRDIRRLGDPKGAVPEIHDRLHLVGPHEELIFLKNVPPSAAPESTP